MSDSLPEFELRTTDIDEVTVIRPGDTLVLRLASEIPPCQVDQVTRTLRDRLRARLPGVDVLLITGVDGLAVYRPDAQAEAGDTECST